MIHLQHSIGCERLVVKLCHPFLKSRLSVPEHLDSLRRGKFVQGYEDHY